MLIKSLLLSKKKKINQKIPIWFMRQAGRYLPEYKDIRKKEKDFIKLCLSPTLAAKISLQPITRFNLDGIIPFSDILIIPYALGQKVSFKTDIGPILSSLTNYNDLPETSEKDWQKKLSPVFRTLKILKKRKDKDKTLIGFCGSPLTVLTYMIEGGTSKNHLKTKAFLLKNPIEAKILIDKLVCISIFYLKHQIKAGVDVIQIFESWSSILDGDLYTQYIVEPNKQIVEAIKSTNKETPIICFPRLSNWKTLEFIKSVPCDGLSIDLQTDDKTIEYCKKKHITIQGNLDPVRLLLGGEQLKRSIKNIINKFKSHKFIFNLSHGILPNTPLKNVEKTIKYIREYEKSD